MRVIGYREIMSIPLRKASAKGLTSWAKKQAEVIVDTFLADSAPDDLLRLEQAIAAALRRACERGQARQLTRRRRSTGTKAGQMKKSC